MAEQGAIVTGIDINPQALAAARDRCALYGVQASFVQGNAGTELPTIVRHGQYDAIIFFAVMEHLTLTERLACVRAAWELLGRGQFLIVVETPNRLWHTDFHTSGEPFFMWLPDKVAMDYSRFTHRETFKDAFRDTGENERTRQERLARWGRGVSYHDFEIALDIPASQLPVASAMWDFHRSSLLKRVASRFSKRQRFSQILRSLKPNVHAGFFDPSIDIALCKP
jgi:S-adenosylmethionine-dependent methyltransferase